MEGLGGLIVTSDQAISRVDHGDFGVDFIQ